jgi:hypothetical protein
MKIIKSNVPLTSLGLTYTILLSNNTYIMSNILLDTKISGGITMRNRIKHWSLISVVAGLILLLTGCYAENVGKVNIHFPNGGLLPNENMYIRYDDGSTEKVIKEKWSVTDSIYTVNTISTKRIIGYFVESPDYNWVPPFSHNPTISSSGDTNTLDIDIIPDSNSYYKPTHKASYAKVSLANPSTGVIILYDKYDNPINPFLESADLYVKTDNTYNISFIDLIHATDSVSTSSVTENVYNISSPKMVLFHSISNKQLQEYTVPQLELTVYSGTNAIPVYAYDYVPQLDLNHDGVVDIEDVVRYARNPVDAYNDHAIKDIPFVLSAIEPHSQTLRVITNPFPSSLTLDSMVH